MNISSVISIAIPVIIAIVVIGIIMSGYVKAPTDKAYIITGLRKKRVVIGKSAIKIPFLEQCDKLLLQLIPVDVKTQNPVPTKECIPIMVDAVAVIQIDTSNQGSIDLACANFLNNTIQEIKSKVNDVLEGNMREIIGSMELRAMVNDRKKFGQLVDENAKDDLSKMGLKIVSFNVQNFNDNHGVVDALGTDNTEKIRKDAQIAKAEAQRDIEIKQALATKEANDAKVESEAAIAEKQNSLEIKKAELKRIADEQKAIANAAYSIQEEEQRKTIEAKKAEANLVKQEKAIELAKKDAEIKEQRLTAEVRKQAEAEKFARQQKAEADLIERQKEAEAKRYEMEQEAEAVKVKAQADKFAAEQKAEAIRLQGLADAEAIKAKSIAEAEGIEKKAEAMAKMGQASILEMYFNALPEVVKNAAAPLGQVDKITMYGDGNNSKLVKDIIGTTTQIVDGLKESTGVDLTSVLSGFIGGKLADKPLITEIKKSEQE